MELKISNSKTAKVQKRSRMIAHGLSRNEEKLNVIFPLKNFTFSFLYAEFHLLNSHFLAE